MSVLTAPSPRAGFGQFEDREGRKPLEQALDRQPGGRRWPVLFDPVRQPRWPDEFAEAVGPLTARLHRLARRILRSEDLADDAVQEALISLWLEGRLPPNPAGWLARAVVHRSLHLNRCRRRRRQHEERASAHRLDFGLAEETTRGLESEELGAQIAIAISRLPTPYREVFELREVERMDYESIAGTLRVPVGTVRSRLSRSREALQRSLAELGWPAGTNHD